MSVCELSGKGPVVKNLVSHSNIKTKSRNLPNVQSKSLYSNALGRQLNFKVATTTLRTIEKVGGLDAFILRQPETNLSKRALEVRNSIQRKLRGKGKRNEAKN